MAERTRFSRRNLRYAIWECLIAAGFIGSVFGARLVIEAGPFSPIVKIAALLPAIIALTVWWGLYAQRILGLDELEQKIETRSIAVAGGLTIWITTAWGLLAFFAVAPGLPLVFVAPLAGAIYGAVRLAVALRYR